MKKMKNRFYKNVMFTLLGTTRAISKTDINPPTKWISVLEGVKASSDILYFKLSCLDKDLEEEFNEKEEIIEKRLGKEKFYCQEELEDLKDKRKEIQV